MSSWTIQKRGEGRGGREREREKKILAKLIHVCENKSKIKLAKRIYVCKAIQEICARLSPVLRRLDYSCD